MAFTFAAFSYICALVLDAFLIFFSIFHVSIHLKFYRHFVSDRSVRRIIAFDELKTDYKNPIDQCSSLNPLVLPEYFIHIFFNLMFLIAGEWFTLMFNIPLIAYHIHRYLNRPVMSGAGLYDPTNIMNQDVLNKCQREGWIKLAFYLLSFFFYLYGMIRSLISS
uniref:Protein cornichon n=1 Tax=Daphnia galeata TaxID=27404 RepID=A0A8J2WNT0_9CRUS|nr:unnamed protein product [Daphnia galeata]